MVLPQRYLVKLGRKLLPKTPNSRFIKYAKHDPTLHEIYGRQSEIPNVDDCYLTDIFNAHEGAARTESDEEEDIGCWFVPWKASEFPPLEGARNIDEEGWIHQWGQTEGHIRIGQNTPGVTVPITCTFTWGEGHPKLGGVEMIPHVPSKWASQYCKWCHASVGNVPSDCPELRLRALANAATENERIPHLVAIENWHSKPPKYE